MGTMTSYPGAIISSQWTQPRQTDDIEDPVLSPIAAELGVSVRDIKGYMMRENMDNDQMIAEATAARLMGDRWTKRLVASMRVTEYFGSTMASNLNSTLFSTGT